MKTHILLMLAGMLALSAGACRTSTKSAGAGASERIDVDKNRFPHELHTGPLKKIAEYKGRGLQCSDCHAWDQEENYASVRPGANEHAPCDECHADSFYKAPSDFCMVCHELVDAVGTGETTLRAFPSKSYKRLMASTFPHQSHVNADSMEANVGFHVGCDDCHSRTASGEPTLPGHPECMRCHSGPATHRPAMENCSACHVGGKAQMGRRVLITEGLIFSHSNHVKDRQGATIACDSCHADMSTSKSTKDAQVPQMEACASCHQDPVRTPERVRMARCQGCHRESQTATTPRSHLSSNALPETHTIDFRTNHAEQAAHPNANCQFCHENLSGRPKDSCFQCHEVMRPRDHMLSWRDESHGREAALDRNRCATCHQADYCVACHSVPPRSHQPLQEFRVGGHARNAQFGLSSCMTCHTFQDTCSQCHRGQP